MAMTVVQAKSFIRLADAIHETIKETGPQGAPAGYLYLAMQQVNCSLEMFSTIMGAMVKAGKVRLSNDTYYAIHRCDGCSIAGIGCVKCSKTPHCSVPCGKCCK